MILTCSTVPPAGQYVKGDPSKPLHQCNLYGSKRAGEKLGEMLKMGKSRPWKEVTSWSLHFTKSHSIYQLYLGNEGDDGKAGYEHRRSAGILPSPGEVAEEGEQEERGEGGLGP